MAQSTERPWRSDRVHLVAAKPLVAWKAAWVLAHQDPQCESHEAEKWKGHVGPEFDAPQIEKRMPWHETGWNREGFLLPWGFLLVFEGPDLTDFEMLAIYAHGFGPYVSGISNRLHWCCSTPAGMAARSEASEESDKQNRKVANKMSGRTRAVKRAEAESK